MQFRRGMDRTLCDLIDSLGSACELDWGKNPRLAIPILTDSVDEAPAVGAHGGDVLRQLLSVLGKLALSVEVMPLIQRAGLDSVLKLFNRLRFPHLA